MIGLSDTTYVWLGLAESAILRMVDITDLKNKRINTIVTSCTISGVVILFLGWALPEGFTANKSQILFTTLAFLCISIWLAVNVYLADSSTDVSSPVAVKYIKKGYMPEGGFVVKNTNWLMQNLLYTVVLEEDDGFERILGMAKYIMAQNNGLVQLMVIVRSEESSPIWDRFDKGELDQMKSIRIKIGTPAYD